ncbi:DUF1833 family protein [Tardiphaga sp.]|uniref:DUF1833 family protein n=1 Tax=Tardiphaga sp. TaxID=1926292 RepID=UPI0026278815|nr:DUF1833 family protein [Tardiphaga sp.]MDB5618472.1 hypothetical protein [Tardiphaga sp.]
MPQLSLSFREAFNAENTDEFPVILVEITPPGLGETLYICSEPAVRLSADPLRYGIVHLGQEYQWIVMTAAWPDDQDGRPPATTLVFANVVEDMAATVRGVTPGTQTEVVLKMVLSSAPDDVEESYIMRATNGSYNAQQVTLDVSREPIEAEPYPAQRMTKNNYPGLFR